jgi:hypothetical protein
LSEGDIQNDFIVWFFQGLKCTISLVASCRLLSSPCEQA